MKAEDLRLDELVEFTEGRLSLHGRRLVLHDIHAMAQLRKDLVEMLGLDNARRILTRFGYYWGQEDAAAMKRLFRWDNTVEWIKAGARLHSVQGVALSMIEELDLDESAGKLRMEVLWHDSGEAEEHLIEFGRTEYPVCWMLAGYWSGYCSFCTGTDVYFIERKCLAEGQRVCLAEGRDLPSWGGEIEPFLTFYQAQDVKGKVERLTRELKQKSRELARERRKLNTLRNARQPFLVEVHSESFRRVLELANRIAPYDTSVLITGETGTGKEVLARYLHRRSSRSSGRFLAINCGALPENLLESELFGHKAGSFTGAIADHQGLFEEASKGTVLLDEIGDISPAMQLKILRVLQEKEIKRVGENAQRKVDVRVLAATNRDLESEVGRGAFREDLFYRLRVIEVRVPPLRERREDILPLTRYFVKQMSQKLRIRNLRLDASCIEHLQAYHWPGNVRELENAVERAAVLSRDGLILPEYLPQNIIHAHLDLRGAGDPLNSTLAQVEKRQILAVLEGMGGNRSRTARILGISPATLWRKLKRMDRE
ncbi:MAG: sigma-54-dependent Fis family transcriptional regulator [Candidatus Glassbacteria bacterium]|nr:sigma-54-dependent Fis family transcriptional regulator [Candidatus Glassbacteria bacterium]